MAMILEGKILFVGAPDALQNHPDPVIQKFIHAELPPLTHQPERL
jgi:ABC-type transporter Mla maintaining outer membrane lipid asymmetry ATPase subunit MlaF